MIQNSQIFEAYWIVRRSCYQIELTGYGVVYSFEELVQKIRLHKYAVILFYVQYFEIWVVMFWFYSVTGVEAHGEVNDMWRKRGEIIIVYECIALHVLQRSGVFMCFPLG